MDALRLLPLFLAVAEDRSFTAASKRMGLSRSAAGKAIARLEERMGTPLFQRTTRSVRLTDAGEALLERAVAIREEWQAVEASIAEIAAEPRGMLRVALPAIGHRLVAPHLASFLHHYPSLSIDLDQDDHIADLTTAKIDVAIRSGPQADSTHRSRRLAAFRFLLVASPAYLKRRGLPRRPTDLTRHALIRFRFSNSERLQSWRLSGAEDAAHAAPAVVSTNMEGVRAAACAGLGIAQVPDFLAAEDLAEHRLVSLLDDWSLEDVFWLVWPNHLHGSPKVRAFVGHLVAKFADK